MIERMMKIRTLPPKPNNPKIKAYAEALEKGRNSMYFVVKTEEGWFVRKPGEAKKTTFTTKKEAMKYAQSFGKEIVYFDKAKMSMEVLQP